jgi:hypothetical protein
MPNKAKGASLLQTVVEAFVPALGRWLTETVTTAEEDAQGAVPATV